MFPAFQEFGPAGSALVTLIRENFSNSCPLYFIYFMIVLRRMLGLEQLVHHSQIESSLWITLIFKN